MLVNASFKQQLVTMANAVNIVMMQVHRIVPELTVPALNIATTICWESEDGFELVYRSLENYRVEKGYKDYLDPLTQLLTQTTNVVMVAAVCTFLNTFVEASSNEKLRRQINKDCHRKKLDAKLAEIKTRINEMEYQLNDCCYEVVLKRLREQHSPTQEFNEDPIYLSELMLPMLYERDTRKVHIIPALISCTWRWLTPMLSRSSNRSS
jgi:diaphanous 1